MTRCVASLERDPEVPNNVWLWNPAGASLEDVCGSLGLSRATIAIIGGTAAYDLFLDRYAEFHLCRAGRCSLPRGTPVFSQVGNGLSPDDVLRTNGMEPETARSARPRYTTLTTSAGGARLSSEAPSALAAAGAVVPAMQQQIRNAGKEQEDQNSGRREIRNSAANMRGMLSRKPDSTMRNAKSRARPGRPRRDFRDDRPDQRQSAADPQAAKKIRQRGGKPQQRQLLPRRGAVKLEEVDEIVVGRRQTQRGIREDGERTPPGTRRPARRSPTKDRRAAAARSR